ncbi:glycosyltransferase family 9 protein [Phormidium tenue FACHB-886]|nr:glycosyltransferase family 9 protein [Phormidium tenue FACHB-886]
MAEQRILFIELLGGIGDVAIALPAIHAVARSHPAARLTVLTFAPGDQLLTADPLIDRVVCAPKGEARQAVDQLLQESFDLIISDTNYDGIADAIQRYSQQYKIPPKVVTNLWRSPPPDRRVSQRFLDILQAEGVITPEATSSTVSEIHLTASEKAIARQQLGALYRPLVFLCTDAGMAIKRWPSAHFIHLGKALQQRYGATVIVPIGEDPAAAAQIAAAIGGTAQVWQRGSLRALAALLAEADLVVSGDTGLAHIAAALHVPTVTLFGPSWAGRYGHPAPHIDLQGFPACPERDISNFTQQRCWYRGQCPYDWQTCLEDISPETVLEAAEKLLTEKHVQIIESPAAIAPVPSVPLDWRSVRHLLVMRLDNIGDVIMTTPALKALRQALPQTKITLMASPAGALTAPLLPWVDHVLPWRVLWQDLGKLAFDVDREWQLIKTLKDQQFDAAIIFTSFSQSPHPAGLVCNLAGIPLRAGESKEQDCHTLTHAIPPAPDHFHQAERNLRLIEALGIPIADRHLTLSAPPLANPDPYLLLNPWTSCQSRNYPADRFAMAAQRLSDLTGWSVVVTGVEKDRDRSQILLEILGDRAVNLIGKTNLTELASWIGSAKLVLTSNTSVMHIADAMQTPTVVLFAGTEQKSQWYLRHTWNRFLNRSTVCSPCYAMTCPHQLQCLEIAPDAVVAAALELLQAAGLK